MPHTPTDASSHEPFTPAAAVEVATRSWSAQDFTSSTIDRMGEVARRFARRHEHLESVTDITAAQCEDFVHAPTRHGTAASTATQHFRRTTLRAVFRTLRQHGIDIGDPTVDLSLAPKTQRRTRPLTDDEIQLVRLCALGAHATPRAAAALALAEATATTREIPSIEPADVDLDTGEVRLPGGARVDTRTGTLTRWGINVLREHLRTHPGHGPVVASRSHPDRLSAQAGTCNLLGVLLHTAGLRHEPDVRPGSIRAWAGTVIHRDTGRIDTVATRLGLRSLDAAADAIAFDWKNQQ